MLRNCIEAVQHWLDINGLSMNPEKTKATAVGTTARHRTDGAIGTVDLGKGNLTVSRSVRRLGRLDSQCNEARTCFIYILC